MERLWPLWPGRECTSMLRNIVSDVYDPLPLSPISPLLSLLAFLHPSHLSIHVCFSISFNCPIFWIDGWHYVHVISTCSTSHAGTRVKPVAAAQFVAADWVVYIYMRVCVCLYMCMNACILNIRIHPRNVCVCVCLHTCMYEGLLHCMYESFLSFWGAPMLGSRSLQHAAAHCSTLQHTAAHCSNTVI